MKKRLFAVLASLCMVVSMVPTMAFAQDSGTTIGVSDLCEHHTEHTSDCGYTEGTPEQPCAHEHTDECYAIAGQCVHTVHDESCGGLADPTVCTHVCGEDTGCVIKTLNCQHQHDESCGYVPAAEGTPCTFVCEVCSAQDSGNPGAPSDAQPEECTCETLCTGEEINGDCPVCSAEGAELDKVCVGVAPMLPVTALAAPPGDQVIYVGNENVTSGGYWTTDSAGTVTAFTGEGSPADKFIHYDAENNVLTLHNATIKESVSTKTNSFIAGAAIGVHNQNGAAELTITLEGTNTIAGVGKGIYVLASSNSTGDASLTITSESGGSLDASASQTGIWVQSNSGNATLTIRNAKVEATGTSYGVNVQSRESSTAALTVNGGSLTASGSPGILYDSISSGTVPKTTALTISNSAIVDARGGGIGAGLLQELQKVSPADNSVGIVFDGNEGTVYGNVTLQEDLEIGKDETLTIGKDASLTVPEETTLTNDGTITVENGGNLTGKVNSQQPPQITTPPQSQIVTEGENAKFSVTASGNPLTYQWQQKTTESDSSWTDISGAATASYTTEATTTSMNGCQYRCVVTASGVSVISAPATLTVNELITYTITVHGSAGGTATADKTAAAAGETVNLTATPASGYHFDGWSAVPGTVTIQNNQFIMPAENVEIRAVFDRNSSSVGSGGSSYRDREYEFWMDVKEQIRDADPGDTIKVNARSYDRMPWSVMEALREAEDVTLRITWVGGEDIIIPSAAALNKDNGRIYYPLSYLEGLDFSEPAEQTGAGQTGSTVEVEAPASNPAGWQPTAPTEGQTQEQPESEPEESSSQPESEPASEPETEPETEPEAQPDEETMAQPESGGLPLALILGGGAAVIAAGLGFWLWKRRSQE